jgi:CRP-like cAMP-binding protein
MKHSTLEPMDLDKIQSSGTVCHYQPGDVIFSEGDPADRVYFIESGTVQVFLYEFTNRVEIGQRGSGEFFGEMSVISQGKRTASIAAVTDTKLIVLDREQFLKFLNSDSKVSAKVNRIIAERTKELILKENLLATAGIKSNHLQISIKGDPSLRESAFARERYESVVDKVLPELIPKLKILLLERCVNEIFLQFNSGEIRLTSIFDPFNYEIHPASKLIDDSYLDRHFPVVAYTEKARLIRRLYDTIASEFGTLPLPKPSKDAYQKYYKSWQPLAQEEIVKIIDKLPVLRSIPDFYLRNLGISITRDAIRMQFNCDGTHFVSTQDYSRFLADNVGLQEAG